jgi:DNA-binding response OmpR family regulator
MAKRILICDDVRHIARLIQMNLERQGYDVEVACSGKDALIAIHRQIADMVILDAVLSDMDGFEVLRAIRIDPLCDSTPVIMLLESADDETVFKVFNLGGDMWVAKGKDADDFFGKFRL